MPDLVFFLIQLDLRRHPTSLVTIAVLANRSKNIGIHLSVSRVRCHPLGFNSSGNFCDRRDLLQRNFLRNRRDITIATRTAFVFSQQ
jgi:hypothetical protein